MTPARRSKAGRVGGAAILGAAWLAVRAAVVLVGSRFDVHGEWMAAGAARNLLHPLKCRTFVRDTPSARHAVLHPLTARARRDDDAAESTSTRAAGITSRHVVARRCAPANAGPSAAAVPAPTPSNSQPPHRSSGYVPLLSRLPRLAKRPGTGQRHTLSRGATPKSSGPRHRSMVGWRRNSSAITSVSCRIWPGTPFRAPGRGGDLIHENADADGDVEGGPGEQRLGVAGG